MRRLRTIALPLLLVVTLSSPASAWHKEGHMAVARMAWYQLTDKQKTRLGEILKAHPHYELFLIADRPSGVSEVEWAFVRAATWPDWVRDPQAKDLTARQKSDI